MDTQQNNKWIIAYAKVILNKETGIITHSVYFGGISHTEEKANEAARECINTIKGGTIIPKIFRIAESTTIVDALYDAEEKFEMIVKRMQEANSIIKRDKSK